MKSRQEIKSIGKSRFQARYWPCVGAFAIVAVVLSALTNLGNAPVQLNVQLSNLSSYPDFEELFAAMAPILMFFSMVGAAASLIIGGPLSIGLNYFFIQLILGRNDRARVFEPFPQAFKNNFGRKLGGYLWMQLFVFLWSLLFIVPGIIKSYSYALTPYILADCPNVRAKDALKLSMRIMNGRKWQLFVFGLSYLGWNILSVLTVGILTYFYVGPWQSSARACWYLEAREDALRRGVITMAELEGAQPVA